VAVDSATSSDGPKRSRPLCGLTTSPAPSTVAKAYGIVTRSALGLIATFTREIAHLEEALSEHFETHPDAKIVLSLPGLGTVLGARVLGEFGDDRTRFSSSKSPKNYAGTSPVTKASGRTHVVLARFARNRRLGDALDQWAFCATNASPGARSYYDELRARGKTIDSHYDNWRTAWWASSTPASKTAPSTTSRLPGVIASKLPLDSLRPWGV
jgi:transposase